MISVLQWHEGKGKQRHGICVPNIYNFYTDKHLKFGPKDLSEMNFVDPAALKKNSAAYAIIYLSCSMCAI